ncbi:hypothetical protein VNO78_17286 [Psophocarpus tetragonolobus]|uniref:Uncharacterized protein n=1 Tax=Psophocarpus tetragonolobus TaxID=3891 RepID=A0AAN9SI85_PSOTE
MVTLWDPTEAPFFVREVAANNRGLEWTPTTPLSLAPCSFLFTSSPGGIQWTQCFRCHTKRSHPFYLFLHFISFPLPQLPNHHHHYCLCHNNKGGDVDEMRILPQSLE